MQVSTVDGEFGGSGRRFRARRRCSTELPGFGHHVHLPNQWQRGDQGSARDSGGPREPACDSVGAPPLVPTVSEWPRVPHAGTLRVRFRFRAVRKAAAEAGGAGDGHVQRAPDGVVTAGVWDCTSVPEGIAHSPNMCSLPAFYLTRDGMGFCVRTHRYALAIAGGSVAAGVLGLHECDNPVCVKIADATAPRCSRVRFPGRQHGADGADGSRGWSPCGATLRPTGLRRERSVALRDAVRNGWDAAAVQAALLGDQPTLW